MPQVTQNQRAQIIADLIREANKQPPTEKHPVERIQGIKGGSVNCDVITISADQLLLNPNSHRVRAQLLDDPDWIGSAESPGLSREPFDDRAQSLIADFIRKSEYFSQLKHSLLNDGQAQNALVTHEGVLINGNTRAVALRESTDPTKRYIRVAVLPSHVDPIELSILELRLQEQKELKSEYSTTNRLLFVEDLRKAGMGLDQINVELRYAIDNPKKGIAEVQLRLDSLDFIRFLQQRDGLRLTDFDRLGFEQIREAMLRYKDLQTNKGPSEANRYLDTFVLSMLTGNTAVHNLRTIDESFIADYMVPQLESDEEVGLFTPQLLAATSSGAPVSGSNKLTPRRHNSKADPSPDIKGLISIVASPKKEFSFEQDGKRVTLENSTIARAVGEAIAGGIREKKRTARAEDKLAAPLEALRDATKLLQHFLENYSRVKTDRNFDRERRQRLMHAFRNLRRRYRDTEKLIAEFDA